MRGARLALLPVAGMTLLAAPSVAAATTPPSPPPTSTAPDATTTTVSGATAPTTTAVAVPTPPRSGSAIGELDRRSDDETWSVRRLATATLLGIAALALVGHVYGRIQSISPRVGRAITRPSD